MAKPLLSFKKMKEINFLELTFRVIDSMRKNVTLFPQCDPPVEQLEETYRQLSRAIIDAAYRDIMKVELKNQLLKQMKAELHLLSLYVTRVSNGVRSVILASGFDCSEDPGIVGVAPSGRNLRVTPVINNPGTAKFKMDVWEKAKAYLFEYRKVGDPLWIKVFNSKSTYLCRGLEPHVLYEARAAYIVRDPTISYSNVVTFYVL